MYQQYKASLLGGTCKPISRMEMKRTRTKSRLRRIHSEMKVTTDEYSSKETMPKPFGNWERDTIKGSSMVKSNGNHRHDEISQKDEMSLKLIRGNCKQVYEQNAKIVRIFTSSTFTDTRHERNALMERVYPKLKEFCRDYGYEFQVVDMRWGIRDESSNQHTTTELCMKELEACKRLSVGPNFVTFLSHKYGYRPFPRVIEAVEFENIIAVIEDVDAKDLLKKWFRKDENLLPVSYQLQPISTFLPDYIDKGNKDKYIAAKNTWWQLNDIMAQALAFGASQCLSKERAHHYLMSVTEQEITDGILKAKDTDKHCLWFKRDILDIEKQKESYELSRFKDIYGPKEVIEQARGFLEDLKTKKIPFALKPENISAFQVSWGEKGVDPDKLTDHKTYIDNLCSNFEMRLKDMIKKGIDDKSRESFSDPIYDEILQHIVFSQNKSEGFYGREDTIEKIKLYVQSESNSIPLILHGESGSGKTSVMAVAAQKCQEWLGQKAIVVLRFVGTTPDSSTLRALLLSVLQQIQLVYGIVPTFKENLLQKGIKSMNLAELENTFKHVITNQLNTVHDPLIILIDSLDQFSPDGTPQNLSWLPAKIGKNTRLILSTLPDGNIESYGYMTKLKALHGKVDSAFVEVLKVGDADVENILKNWLQSRNRSLTTKQTSLLKNAFSECQTPTLLYLKLCFEEAVLWPSYQPIDESILETTVRKAIIALFNRIENSHGLIFTCKTLGYLTAARNGLSDTELEDILACDENVLNDVYQFWTPPVRRLPPLLLVRLKADLQQYLVERGSEGIKVSYWHHRQFIEAARTKYLLEQSEEYRMNIHKGIAEYFLGKWADKSKTFEDKDGKEDSKFRFVAKQPLKYIDAYNTRKLMELPLHLIKGKMTNELETMVLYNMEWLISKLNAISYYDVISDFELALEEVNEDLNKETLSDMLDILRLSQVAIEYDPYQLAAQFLGRSEEGVECFRKQCLSPIYPVLLPLQPCLASIGGALKYQLSDHKDDVSSVDCTRDGTIAVTCSDDKTIKIWDIEKGILNLSISDIISAKEELKKIRLCCNDSRIIVLVSGKPNYLLCFSLESGQDLKIPRNLRVWEFEVFDAGRKKAVLVWDCSVSVIDMQTFDVILEPVVDASCSKFKKNYNSSFSEIALAASKDIIAIAYGERNWFSIFNSTTKEYRQIQVYNKPSKEDDYERCVDALTLADDGSWAVASNYMENDLEFYDTATGKHLRQIKGTDKDSVSKFKLVRQDVLIFPNGKSVCLWDLKTGNREYTCCSDSSSIQEVAVTDDQTRFVTVGSENIVRVWDFKKTDKKSEVVEKAKISCRKIYPFPNNWRYIMLHILEKDIGDKIGWWEVYDIAKQKAVRKIKINAEFKELNMLKDNVIVLSVNNRVKVLNLDTCEVESVLQGKLIKYPEMTVIGKTNDVVTFTRNKRNLKVMSITSGKTTHILNSGQEEKLENIKANLEGTVVVTQDSRQKNNAILVFSLESYELLYTLQTNENDYTLELGESDLTHDGRYLIHSHYGYFDKEAQDQRIYSSILAWDLVKGKLQGALHDETAMLEYFKKESSKQESPENSDYSCMLLLHGKKPKVIQGSQDGVLRIFDLQSGEIEQRITVGNKSSIDSFLPNGQYGYDMDLRYMCSKNGVEGTMWMYDTSTCKPLASFSTENSYFNSVLVGDGSIIIGTTGNTQKITQWNLRGKDVSTLDVFKLPDLYDTLHAMKEEEINLLDPNDDEVDPNDPDQEEHPLQPDSDDSDDSDDEDNDKEEDDSEDDADDFNDDFDDVDDDSDIPFSSDSSFLDDE